MSLDTRSILLVKNMSCFNGGFLRLMGLCQLQLFNGALSAGQAFNGTFSSSLLDYITTEKMNHHTAVLFNGAFSARSFD